MPADSDDLPLRFAFPGLLHDVMQQHFDQDARNAKLSNKFKVYYRLRPYIPIAVRQLLQRSRGQGMEVASDWYLPSKFLTDWQAALAAQLASSPDQQVLHPWPDGASLAVCLTHDVETQVGVGLVPRLAALEEEYGFRSAWNFIPHKYRIDPGLLRDLRQRGHEIGVHGYNHDGRLFLTRSTFAWRAKRINAAIERFGSTGFRAPMVHRNLRWLQSLNVQYDASCFDVDPFQAMPGGVGSVWPFIAGRFVELPYTLPQDHTLLIALGEQTPRIWVEKLKLLAKLSGMAMLVTHPDYLDVQSRLNVYRQLLEHLQQLSDTWCTLPQPIAEWWRERDQSQIDAQENVEGPACDRGRVCRLDELFHAFRSGPLGATNTG